MYADLCKISTYSHGNIAIFIESSKNSCMFLACTILDFQPNLTPVSEKLEKHNRSNVVKMSIFKLFINIGTVVQSNFYMRMCDR